MEERRIKFRQGLHALYLPIYDSLCSLLPGAWAPFSGLRTFDQQAALYAQGRTNPGRVVTNAPAGESPHNYGCASDWIYWSDNTPLWLGASDPRWQEYFKACDQAHAKKGHDFGDNPHNELPIQVSWVKIYQEYIAKGLSGAFQMIEENLK